MKRDGKDMIDRCLTCKVADCQGTCKRAAAANGTGGRAAAAKETGRRRRNRLYEIDGVEDTLSGWARRCGLKRQTVYERLRAGRTIREALERRDGRLKKRYAIDGEEDTLEGWARRRGIDPQVIRRRMKGGSTLEEALSAPARAYERVLDGHKHILTARGRTLDLVEWAALLGVKRMALYMRLRNHGFDMEEAVRYYEKKTGVVIDAQASGDAEKGGDNSGQV